MRDQCATGALSLQCHGILTACIATGLSLHYHSIDSASPLHCQCTISALSLHCHCITTPLSARYQCIIAALPTRCRCIATEALPRPHQCIILALCCIICAFSMHFHSIGIVSARSLHHRCCHFVIAALALHYRRAVGALSLHCHCTPFALSLHHHYINTLQSQQYQRSIRASPVHCQCIVTVCVITALTLPSERIISALSAHYQCTISALSLPCHSIATARSLRDHCVINVLLLHSRCALSLHHRCIVGCTRSPNYRCIATAPSSLHYRCLTTSSQHHRSIITASSLEQDPRGIG